MESRSLENSSDPHPIPVYIAPYQDRGDEVNLIELWRVIARRKGIILLSLLASMMLAAIYIFFAEPVYKANAYLLPPQQKNIQGLLIDYRDIEGIDIDRYTPESVYSAFLDNLKSQGVRREFFDKHELIKHYASGKLVEDINADRIFEEFFNEQFNVQVEKQDISFVTVSFSDGDPKLAAQWLNEVIDFANMRTVRQLFSDVNAAIQSEIGKVRYQLGSKLKLAQQRRRDTIVTLSEALRIANTLGIKDANAFSKMAGQTQSVLAVNTAAVPLYMRGTKALETEIAVLESRKSDESFIKGFRDLQERLAYLEGISIDTNLLSAVAIDQEARVPYELEKPRKLLIFMLASLLGLAGGSLLAIFMELFSRIKGASQSDPVS